MTRSILRYPFTALLLAACPPPKQAELTATTLPEDTSDGHSSSLSGSASSAGVSASASGTTAPSQTSGPDLTSAADDTTGTSGTSDGTTSSAGTTDAEKCQPEPAPPAMCNKLTKLADDDHEALGASTGDCNFICPDDLPDPECDLFEQDCPEGQKCNSWSSDGDSSWDSTRCVPIVPDPSPVGAPCTAEGDGVSGLDTCEKGAMCWDVDPDTGVGTCIEQCTCSEDNPICATPNSVCLIANDGALALCLPSCDPIDPNTCKAGEVCVPDPGGELFICVLDASGAEGQQADPCEFINACDPAHLCADPALLPGCDVQSVGCCVPYCDLSAADCPPGTECLPWYEPGQAPQCFEDVGVCGNQP